METNSTLPSGSASARPALRFVPRIGVAGPLEPLSFRRTPLLAAALCFALGDCLAWPWTHYRPAWLLLASVLLLVAATLAALRSSVRFACVPVLALWVVLGFWVAEMAPAPAAQSALQLDADGLSRSVTGRVLRIRELPRVPTSAAATPDNDNPAWEEIEGPPTISFDLAVDSVEHLTPDLSTQQPESGGVRVNVVGDSSVTLHCGDRLTVPLRMRRPERLGDPGIWQYADYLAGQGIAAHAALRSAVLAKPGAVEQTRGGNLHCELYRVQSWAADRLLRFVASSPNRALPAPLRLTPTDAGMLNAMLFGDRDRLTRNLRVGFERTGSFHLFVVSGMHVALLAALVFWLSRRCRLNDLVATLVTIALTAAYAVLTGFGAPVQRALLMSSIFLLARLLSRERNVLNAIGVAALAILVAAPASLFEAGLQMTLLAIFAIAGIALPLGEQTFLRYADATRNLGHIWSDRLVPPHLAQLRVMLRLWGEYTDRLLRPFVRRGPGAKHLRYLPATLLRGTLWFAELLLIGLVAELIMALPMAMYFHRATPFGLPANIFSIPLIAVLAPAALVTFLLSLVNFWLATLPAAATALLLHGITAIIDHVSRLRGADLRMPQPPAAAIVTALLLWALCIWAVRLSRRSAWLVTAALPVATLILLWPYPARTTPKTLEVTAIDVGQGDSLLVVNPEGRTMLVDAGGPTGRPGNAPGGQVNGNSSQSNYDIGEDVVSAYLWSRRIRSLDIVALTHAHSDHMGGMAAVLRNFHPRELWVGIDPDSAAYRALLAEATGLGIAIRHLHAGQSVPWGEVNVQVLAPTVAYKSRGAPSNADSLVLHLQYDRASALLEGDAESAAEQEMVASGTLAPVTLLKVGHHGSLTSTTPAFLNALSPQDAVVSVGRQNTFGHPRGEIIERLAQAHVRLFRTDEFGLTQFLLTPDGRIEAKNPRGDPETP